MAKKATKEEIRTKRNYVRREKKEEIIREIRTLCSHADNLKVPDKVIDGSYQDAVDFKQAVQELLRAKERLDKSVSTKMTGDRLIEVKDGLSRLVRRACP